MRQIIQNYRTGKVELVDVPVPQGRSNDLLIRNIASLISIGTERSIIELGRKSLLGKARTRPDLVKRFMTKARNDGFVTTFKTALQILDSPTPLGYSSAGIVIETGEQVQEFAPGDKVSCIGAGYACHAEHISVPVMLSCKIPDNVSFEEASFGMLGTIALHGIRSGNLTFGSTAVVIGLGLLGLLSVQLLKAYGCQVFGLDIDPHKAELAKALGADYASASEAQIRSSVEKITAGQGADAVIVTAATKSAEPINLAVELARFRGKIVVVGVADVHPQRNEMWHKEVEIIVSKAGGPGTFDPFYENKGIDYPAGYVRWTENRNLQEFMRLLSEGRVDVKPLITHRYPIDQAMQAYEGFAKGTIKNHIGIVLTYSDEQSDLVDDRKKILTQNLKRKSSGKGSQIVTGVIGAGLFGKALLLPALKGIGNVRLKMLATHSSANTYHAGNKYGFEECTTDYQQVLGDDEINSVLVLTPHSLHATMVCEALKAGKDVFVEKPLCINEEELKEIITTHDKSLRTNALILMVGYNRRFSPHAGKIAEYFTNRHDPMVINYRINAGFVPSDHWVHSEEQGGGRIIGEICHFVDLTQFITRSNPIRVFGERISGNNQTAVSNDNVAISFKFADGSVGNIVYSASGDKAFSRERIEIFCEGKTVVSNDFRETHFHKAGKKTSFKTFNQSMGYQEELKHFFDVVKGATEPKLSPDEVFYSTAAVFAIHESIAKGLPVTISIPS